ncbi:MAG TPA: hypothetical protein VMW17_03770 [Candidatus Binatia bacterium]|nr:hypothetical protein [Candidatus Binatia bacterium]
MKPDVAGPGLASTAGISLVAVAGGVAALAVLHWGRSALAFTPHFVFLANVAVVFVVATTLAITTRRQYAAAPIQFPRWEIIAVIALTAVGAAMRTARWEVFPPADGQLLEEPQTAWNAVRSIRSGHIDPYFPIVNLICEAGFRVLGPTMNGMRVPFAIVGILSVPIFHIAIRALLRSPRAALFATALFATNSMLAGSSRIALETMHPIVTTVIAMAVVFRAGRRPTIGNCALAGACNGLLLTEYDSYRLVPVLSFIFLAMRLTIRPPDDPTPHVAAGWRRSFGCLVTFGAFVVAIEVARLLIVTDLDNPFEFLGEALRRHDAYLQARRAAMTWSQLIAEEGSKFETNLQLLLMQGEHAEVLPLNMGEFDPNTGALGAVALAFCLLGAWWQPLRLYPVIAMTLLTVLSSVLVGKLARYRLLPAIPYYLLSIGFLVEAIDFGLPRLRRWLTLVLIAAAVALGIVNAERFFAVAIWDPQVQEVFYDLSMVLSGEISKLQREHPGEPITVVSDQVHLAVANDYAFWYDYEKVKVFGAPEAIHGRAGYLLAHDQFIPKVEDFPELRDCERWTTKFNRNVMLRCRIAKPGD